MMFKKRFLVTYTGNESKINLENINNRITKSRGVLNTVPSSEVSETMQSLIKNSREKFSTP